VIREREQGKACTGERRAFREIDLYLPDRNALQIAHDSEDILFLNGGEEGSPG